MKDHKIIIISIVGILIIISAILIFNHQIPSNSSKNTVTDMIGRNVDVPTDIKNVYALSASTSVLTYMLVPDKMIGWESNRSIEENRYLPEKYKNLPILGGGKQDANYESIISKSPDVVFIGHGGSLATVNKIQEKFGEVPALDVEGDNNLSDIEPSITFIGKVVGEQEKSAKLIKFYEKVEKQVNNTISTIPDSERKKVYYGRGSDGLKTYAPGSPQTQLIEICGGKNVVQAPVSKGGMGVSMEIILQWNPDVIITGDSEFYKNVYSDPLWSNVNAVKNREVYLVPNSPFTWFENPPGANTIIGIPWMAKVLYPDKFKDLDLKNLTKEFYSDFYHYQLSDEDVNNILNSSGVK
jgi:iron complex transport system substrate-binding protein